MADWTDYSGEAGNSHNHRPESVDIPITALRAGDSPRLNGEDDEHVRVLAALEGPLPPILVHRDTMQVVDGMHRLRAAVIKGQEVIRVIFFDGNEVNAFVAAVKANMAHGLPLTLADREAAAVRIVRSHPEQSNRWIAAVTGLAAATVASIRRKVESGDNKVTARIGRDGRVRPLDNVSGRMIAKDVLTSRPDASLREIAKIAGISPGTVRDVKNRLRRGEDPVPSRQANGTRRSQSAEGTSRSEASSSRVSARTRRSRGSLLQSLRRDPSLRMSESGRALLRWIDATTLGPGEWAELVDAAPPHCVYLVAQLARICADEWLYVAVQLEERLREDGLP